MNRVAGWNRLHMAQANCPQLHKPQKLELGEERIWRAMIPETEKWAPWPNGLSKDEVVIYIFLVRVFS